MNITYAALLDQIKAYQPGKYNTTRNYTNGAVTNWSPYISRGLLSPVLVMEQLKTKYNKQEWIGFMQQMAWREYFQRVWQFKGNLILEDLKSSQSKVVLAALPNPISAGKTGIQALDNAIHRLYEDGMMHNHVRMYISMLHSNIFKAAWLPGAKWMYANLLDHDPAANFLSWQWVAGTFSSKQYVANQENINKYTNTKQAGTFLDTEYEYLQTSIFDDSNTIQSKRLVNWPHPLDQKFEIDVATILKNIEKINQSSIFDNKTILPNQPYCIYNSFNLDPLWHADASMNRILLLEPNHFEQFPVTEKVLQFIVDLAIINIPGLQIFIGNFEELFQQIQTIIISKNNINKSIESQESKTIIYFKEHPTTQHYQGIQEKRDWLFPEVNGYYSSFFGYWKKCERYLK
jgi:deoxyribodipyrimidine photo-lyase